MTDRPFRLDHVHLFCSDLGSTRSWLEQGLGATLVEESAPGGVARLEMRLGDLRFYVRDGSPDPARPIGLEHVGIETTDIDRLHEELVDRGVEVLSAPRYPATQVGVRVFNVRGPDGVTFEFLDRTEQRESGAGR